MPASITTTTDRARRAILTGAFVASQVKVSAEFSFCCGLHLPPPHLYRQDRVGEDPSFHRNFFLFTSLAKGIHHVTLGSHVDPLPFFFLSNKLNTRKDVVPLFIVFDMTVVSACCSLSHDVCRKCTVQTSALMAAEFQRVRPCVWFMKGL